MALPDVRFHVPDGWSVDTSHAHVLACCPEDGSGALQMSVPEEAWLLRDMEPEALPEMLGKMVDRRLGPGHVLAIAPVDLSYGTAVYAEVERGREEGSVWLLVPTEDPGLRDLLLVSWFSTDAGYGETAREIVASLTPSRWILLQEHAHRRARQGIDEPPLEPSAIFMDRPGEITELALGDVPPDEWNDVCRRARAQRDAEMVALVAPLEGHTDLATIYLEHQTGELLLGVITSGPPMEMPVDERRDFFREVSRAAPDN